MERTRKLNYANVVSTLALIVAVAGIPAAVAVTKAKKNTVTSRSIVNGTIKPKDLAGNAITSDKIAPGQVTADDLAATQTTPFVPATLNAEATCPPGSQLLSGGGVASDGLKDIIPVPSANKVEVNGGLSGATPYAMCLGTTPGN